MLRKILIVGAALIAAGLLAIGAFAVFTLQGLPSYKQLADYKPPVTTRVYAGDGSLIAEFANQQRIYVPASAIPDRVKNAFLSAEDKGFYEHSGIEPWAILRGTIGNALQGKRMTGGSTITQQVAKNMLLTSDRTVVRKVKEAFLAERLEKTFNKDRILELYLNEIYLGNRSYGVAAAAQNYFNKPLDQLTIAQAAYLGALPKGPENYEPRKYKERAVSRRNWVIDRMAENGFITEAEARQAAEEDLLTVDRLSGDQFVASQHFVEELRRQMLTAYGEKNLYDGGLSVRSTLDVRLQIAAANALRHGLELYDRRHGWRGPVARVGAGDVAAALQKAANPPAGSGWRKAVVSAVAGKRITVSLADGKSGALNADDVSWAAGARGKNAALTKGAIVYVQPGKSGGFALKQTPAVEGALVAMDPHTGRVLAMVGGYSFGNSQYNRVTQAKRQPGSSFKAIVYTAALEYGLTPATLIDDAPFQVMGEDGKLYNPQNYEEGEFSGPSTLRFGLEKSRNAMTVRLAYEMGMDKIAAEAKKFGTNDDLMPVLAMSLGAGETTLMKMANAYATFVNGGKKVSPVLFDRVQDRTGKTLMRGDTRACDGCNGEWSGQGAPTLADAREQLVDPITAYQMTSMLEGVVQRGTGAVIASVGKPLAGKTGTTNDYRDAWFVGFSPDLVAAVWIGFDKPQSLGNGETGGGLAAPIFRDFMQVALKDTPATPFRLPPGVRLVRIDQKTGLLPGPNTSATILEAFKPGTEPVRDTETTPVIFGAGDVIDPKALQGLEAPASEGGIATSAAPPPPPMAAAGRQGESLGGLY